MDTQQEATTVRGEAFRLGVTRMLEELDKLTFIPKEVRENLTQNAAKLCLAEAVAEQKAVELSQSIQQQVREQAPKVQASIERAAAELAQETGKLGKEAETLARSGAAMLGEVLNKWLSATSAERDAVSPQTPPSADVEKPEA